MHTIGEKLSYFGSVFGGVTVSRDSKNAAVRCPICDPADKSKRKLVIRTEDDIAHCWVCGWKSRSLVPLLKKYFPHRLSEYIVRFGSRDRLLRTDGDKPIEIDDNVYLPTGFRLLPLAQKSDTEANLAKKYLTTRGLTEDDMWYYKLGVCSERKLYGRVIIPSYDDQGKLNYYSARSTQNAKPKYLNSDAKRTNVIFNEIYIDWKIPLVLCEGPFDMFKCGQNATCLLGSEINEEYKLFDKIVANNTPIILSLDDDMSEKTQRYARKLKEYDIDVSAVNLGKFHDPGQMTKQDFEKCLQNTQKLTWNNMFTNKLNRATKVSLGL